MMFLLFVPVIILTPSRLTACPIVSCESTCLTEQRMSTFILDRITISMHIALVTVNEAGRLGGLKGGRARAKSLSAKRRSDIARMGAVKRWRRVRDSKLAGSFGSG